MSLLVWICRYQFGFECLVPDGVDWDEKIRRVDSYLVMDYLVEHNQSCS